MNRKKLLYFSIGPVLSAFFALITLPAMAWFFSVEDVGRFAMLQAVITLSVMFFSLAMHQSYVREYHETKDKSKLLKAAFLPGFSLFILASIITLLSDISISKYIFGVSSSQITILVLLSVLMAFFINILTHLLRMQERSIAFSMTQVLPRFGFLITIFTVSIVDFNKNFVYLVSAYFLSLTVTLFVFLLLTMSDLRQSFRSNLDLFLVKKMLVFSLPLVIGSAAYWGLTTTDRFFLKEMSGLKELGIYSVSSSLASGAAILSMIFSNLWHPIVYKWAKGSIDLKNITIITESIFVLVAFVWTLFGIFARFLPLFLPNEYSKVEFLIVACVAAPLFYLVSEATVVGIGISRKSGYAMLSSFFAFLLNILLNLKLIPDYGASGAGAATLISFFVFLVLRTEASSYCWFSLPRFKIYAFSLLYMLLTGYVLVTENNSLYVSLGWFIIFLATLFSFRKNITVAYNYITKVQV